MALASTATGKFFYLFNAPTGAALLARTDVVPIIYSSPYLDASPPPGTGAYAYNATGGIMDTGNIYRAAKIVADWMEHYGYVRGSGRFGGGNYDGACWVHNLGHPAATGINGAHISGMPMLTYHLGDRANPALATGFYPSGMLNSGDLTGDYSRLTLFNASGIADTLVWMNYFADFLKDFCDTRSPQLCYPAKWLDDYEFYGSPFEALSNRRGFEEGNLRACLVDPRATGVPIFEVPNGTGWAPYYLMNTSGDFAAYLVGSPTVVPGTAPSLTSDATAYLNQHWFPHYFGMCLAANDYAVYKSHFVPIKQRFPLIKTSNYQSEVANNRSYPIMLITFAGSSGYVPVCRGDYASPALYPPQLDYYPAESFSETYQRVAGQTLDGSFNSSGNFETVPWLACPTSTWPNATGNYVIPRSDCLAILTNFYAKGGMEVLLFNVDVNVDSGATDENEILALINAANLITATTHTGRTKRRRI